MPRLLRGLLSLTGLLFRALRLAARLAELLFRLPELALELLQLVLEIADLPLDRIDPFVGSVLRVAPPPVTCRKVRSAQPPPATRSRFDRHICIPCLATKQEFVSTGRDVFLQARCRSLLRDIAGGQRGNR